jgi:flagellar hook-associated protein 2
VAGGPQLSPATKADIKENNMAGITNTYDPTSTAQALAEAFTSGRQTILTRQTTQATATEKGLSTLGTALSTFQSSLATLTGLNKTISANSAVFSDTSFASATATATATPGTYSFFVEQVASAHKVSYGGMTDFAGGGSLTLSAGGTPFTIDLSTKATWTVRDLATAINGATGNSSVSAAVVTTGTTSELVLTSKSTGLANKITLSTTGASAALTTKLGATPNQLAPALDAVVRVGSSTGTAITQPGNTFNVIDGVTMTVSKAQTAGSAPVTLTVASDASKTTANAQAFVDAYNKLKSAIDGLVSPGDPESGGAAGAFAGDSGVRALRDRLVNLLRNTGTASLANFGITANRQGTLSLDSARLTKALAANPTGLDTLIGSSAATAPSGIAGQLDSYLKIWTNSTNGQIGTRKDAVNKLQDELADRQTALDKQFDSAYARYLKQFTQLQSVQSNMSYNTSLFDALFSSSKD